MVVHEKNRLARWDDVCGGMTARERPDMSVGYRHLFPPSFTPCDVSIPKASEVAGSFQTVRRRDVTPRTDDDAADLQWLNA